MCRFFREDQEFRSHLKLIVLAGEKKHMFFCNQNARLPCHNHFKYECTSFNDDMRIYIKTDISFGWFFFSLLGVILWMAVRVNQFECKSHQIGCINVSSELSQQFQLKSPMGSNPMNTHSYSRWRPKKVFFLSQKIVSFLWECN